MLTYNRGQWTDDPEYSDNWKLNSKDGLTYEGFESMSDLCLGEHQWLEIEVFASEDCKAKYQFFMLISSPLRVLCATLVADFPSVLMLIKDITPIIALSMEQDKLEMQEEEHKWKARDLEPYEIRKECQHV